MCKRSDKAQTLPKAKTKLHSLEEKSRHFKYSTIKSALPSYKAPQTLKIHTKRVMHHTIPLMNH